MTVTNFKHDSWLQSKNLLLYSIHVSAVILGARHEACTDENVENKTKDASNCSNLKWVSNSLFAPR
jgi:hypothetical protein